MRFDNQLQGGYGPRTRPIPAQFPVPSPHVSYNLGIHPSSLLRLDSHQTSLLSLRLFGLGVLSPPGSCAVAWWALWGAARPLIASFPHHSTLGLAMIVCEANAHSCRPPRYKLPTPSLAVPRPLH